jgi:hypothetical protein
MLFEVSNAEVMMSDHDQVVASEEAGTRCVLDEADAAGFDVEDTSGHGHSWWYVMCTADKQRMQVWSTPRSADNHAKQIRRFISRHSPPEQEGEPDGQL